MNDERFDQLIKASLSWQADDVLAQQPKRLAIRRLAVRLGRSADAVAPKESGTAGRPRHRFARLAADFAVLAVAFVVGIGGVVYMLGPGSRFGPSGPLHVSERHGYSLRLPDADWGVVEIPGQWGLGTFLDAQSPGSDYFERGEESRHPMTYMWLASQAIPAQMSFDGWLYLQDGVTSASVPCFTLQGEYTYATVGGVRARVGVYYCPNFMGSETGWATVQVLVAQDGRGYAMYFWPEQEPEMPPLPEVRREALRWLSGFSFSDADRSR